jgi:hypothetical protein
MRVLYVIGNLGDYHVPRYEALLDLASMRGDDVYLVEIFGKSSVYAFPQDRRAHFFERKAARSVTLMNDASDAGGHWVKVAIGLSDAVRQFAPQVVVTLGYHTSYSMWLCILKLLYRRFFLSTRLTRKLTMANGIGQKSGSNGRSFASSTARS